VELPSKLTIKLGQVLMTPGAQAALEASKESPWAFLTRHIKGDWGDVDAEDRGLNDAAVRDGSRVLSAYVTSDGTRIWVISEADRSATTILLPDEY